MSRDCIFCKIVSGEIPSAKVYEDEDALVILDISPINKGHSLVLSKEHYTDIYDTPEELLLKLASITKKISLATKKSLACDGINIVQNNERTAGQLVFHIHFHIIPRFSHDGIRFDTNRKKYEENEMNEFAEKINASIQK